RPDGRCQNAARPPVARDFGSPPAGLAVLADFGMPDSRNFVARRSMPAEARADNLLGKVKCTAWNGAGEHDFEGLRPYQEARRTIAMHGSQRLTGMKVSGFSQRRLRTSGVPPEPILRKVNCFGQSSGLVASGIETWFNLHLADVGGRN